MDFYENEKLLVSTFGYKMIDHGQVTHANGSCVHSSICLFFPLSYMFFSLGHTSMNEESMELTDFIGSKPRAAQGDRPEGIFLLWRGAEMEKEPGVRSSAEQKPAV